jgi:hypothetical protein
LEAGNYILVEVQYLNRQAKDGVHSMELQLIEQLPVELVFNKRQHLADNNGVAFAYNDKKKEGRSLRKNTLQLLLGPTNTRFHTQALY